MKSSIFDRYMFTLENLTSFYPLRHVAICIVVNWSDSFYGFCDSIGDEKVPR